MEKWSGQFSSSQYPSGVACGQIEVDLQTNDQDPVQDPGYTAPFKVVYSGIFRTGQSIDGTAQVQNGIIEGSLPPSQKLTLSVVEKSPTMVKGTYTSLNPADQGSFQLQKGPLLAGAGCIVM